MNWGPIPQTQPSRLDPASQEGVALLGRWYNAKAAAERAVADERKLRSEVVKAFFPTHTDGTNNLAIPGDSVLKAVFPISYELKATPEQIDNIYIGFNRAPGETGKLIAARLLKTSVEIVKKEYDALMRDENLKQFYNVISPFVVKKNGTPQMKIVPVGTKDDDK